MKTIFLLHVLPLLACNLLAMSDADLQLLERNQSGSAESIHNLLNELSSINNTVLFLREVCEKGTFRKEEIVIHPGYARGLLESLGDKDSLEAVYRRFTTAKDDTTKGRILQKSMGSVLHPAFMSIVGRDLMKESPKVRLIGEADGFDVPYANAVVFLNIIVRSKFFAPSVEAWGRALEEKFGWDHPELYLADIREFWTVNAKRVEAGEFTLVSVPNAPSTAKVEQPSPPSIPPPEPTPEPVKSSVAASIPTPATEQAPAAKTNLVWWIVGLIILAGSVVFLMRKKKRRV